MMLFYKYYLFLFFTSSLTYFSLFICYIYNGDMMRIKVFDLESEKDLEEEMNAFLEDDIEVIDIKYQVAVQVYGEEQIYCFSSMIIYEKK